MLKDFVGVVKVLTYKQLSKKIKENQRKSKKIKENQIKSKKIKENQRKSKKIKEDQRKSKKIIHLIYSLLLYICVKRAIIFISKYY